MNVVNGPRQGHLAEFMVVTIAFAIGGKMNELCAFCRVKLSLKRRGEVIATVQQTPKGDRTGERTIIKEEVNRAARGEATKIGVASVDRSVVNLLPWRFCESPDTMGLKGGKDREANSGRGHKFKRFDIDRSFR